MKFEDILKNAKDNDALKEFLTESAKNELLNWVEVKGIPTIKDFAKSWLDELANQAKNETGWKKIRDTIYFPAIVGVILWLLEKSTEFMVNETSKQ
jgi:hypothetical protein